MKRPPPPGYTTPCRVVRVIDGDTVEVEIVRRVHVRLRDCWAPETRTMDPEEKALGMAAKVSLIGLAQDHEAILHVPTHGEEFGEILTLGRVVGDVWVNETNLAEEQIRRGHARPMKEQT